MYIIASVVLIRGCLLQNSAMRWQTLPVTRHPPNILQLSS